MGRSDEFDAIIIGAGVIGASIGLALSRRGMRTLNIDKLPAAGYGSTSSSSAIIRPFYSAVESCALAHEARHIWKNWPEFLGQADERGYVEYRECGFLLLLAEGGEDVYENYINALDEVGVGYARLTLSDVIRKYPFFSTESFGPPKLRLDENFGIANGASLAGGIFIPQAGYVGDPQLAAHNMQIAAEALGARFQFGAAVNSIEQRAGRVSGLTTSDGKRFMAPVIVNAAGPHSSIINELAGAMGDMRVSTQPMRHEVAHLPGPRNTADGANFTVMIDIDTGIYCRPEIGNNLLVGSTDPDCEEPDFVDAEDFNDNLTEQWNNQVWRAAQRMPELGIPNTAHGVVGLYDVTEDWVPIYDKSSLPGYYMAIGTSGNQFKNAPVVGELMAELIVTTESGRDHDVSPVQFHLPNISRTIDLSFFSRIRNLHTENSGGVLG